MPSLILTRQQARLVDEYAIQRYGIPGLVLMENAGRSCADQMVEMGVSGLVAICCGKGNNGGDGFVIARHFESRGLDAKVLLFCEPSMLQGEAAENYQMLTKTDVPIVVFGQEFAPDRFTAEIDSAEWIVDALLGTGARGQPRPPMDAVIQEINRQPAKKLAVDLPSGLDCDDGWPATDTVRADHTFTLVAAKPGFGNAQAQPFLGRVHVLDIRVPPKVIQEVLEDTGGT